MQEKKIVAVFCGGKSVEHDVSVLSGLQAFNALDQEEYDSFLVYVDLDGCWWIGEALADRSKYHFSDADKKKYLKKVELVAGANQKGIFRTVKNGFFDKSEEIHFDVALLAFHGTNGEDGSFQGLMETAGYAYTGARVLGSSLCMNKALTKTVLRSKGVKVLPEITINKPSSKEGFLNVSDITANLDVVFPSFVKPCNLGSSVGISKVNDIKELNSALLNVFKMDNTAVIEPFIEHLEEYNISVTKAFGKTEVSAIERPVKKGEFLEFKDKYLAGGGLATKIATPTGEGMADLSRVIDPKELTPEQKSQIENDAMKAFETIGGTGAPRIDYLMNKDTGELFLCEINSIPGSFAFYLWEHKKINFTKLLTALVEEALYEKKTTPTCHYDKNATIFNQK